MNLEEIQQAVVKLSPDELSRFHEWFDEFERNITTNKKKNSKSSIEKTLKRMKGSLKGKGGLKTLMEERRKESLS